MIDQNSQDREGDGEWSDVQDITIIPLHSIVLPDGKVLSFGTDERGMSAAQFIYSVWDPATGENKILENTTATNIFCSNMAIDPNTGNVIIMGGDAWRDTESDGGLYAGVNDVTIFDYKTQTIREAETGDMAYARWYGSTTTLANGEILIVGGRDEKYKGSTISEIYNTETGFRELVGAEIADLADNETQIRGTYWYPHVWQASSGAVYVIESEGKDDEHGDVFVMDVEGDGAVSKIDTLPFQTRTTTPSIMYDVDKVLIIADDGWVWKGDLSTAVPTWEKAYFIEDENNPGEGIGRTNGSFVLLPDGRVAICGGGESETILGNQLADAQYGVLVWDPDTGEVETWADEGLARLYHSSGQLLPDGTIWSGGGGAPGPLQNTNIEVFTPPYLYDEDGNLADRPDIVTAPTNIDSGDSFWITVDDASAITEINAIRSGSSTHARNSDARFVSLDFDVINSTTIRVNTPEANVLSPGLWMMFAIDDDGVPSEGSLLGVDMAQIIVPDEADLPDNYETDTYTGIYAILNDFFDRLDGPVFTLLSGFMNGLVDLSDEKADFVSGGSESLATSFLDLFGADTTGVLDENALNPLLQPIEDGADAFFAGAYKLVYDLGDTVFRIADNLTDSFADLGDAITAATGNPTPILDQMEFYMQLLTTGATYGFTEVSKNIIDTIEAIFDDGLGVLSGLMGLGNSLSSDPFGLFTMGAERLVDFDGTVGVAGLESNRMATALGDELVYINEAESVLAGAGSDLITLYAGADQVNLGGTTDTLDNGLAINRGDVGTVQGTGGRDFIAEGRSSVIDTLTLLGGDDRVFAAGVVNSLAAGDGADTIEVATVGTAMLGNGNDVIVADDVLNMVNGGAGNDSISIITGNADGGAGADTFYFVEASDGASFTGGDGWDKLIIDLDEAGITYRELCQDTGVWNIFGGNLTLWGREIVIESLNLTVSGIEEIAFA